MKVEPGFRYQLSKRVGHRKYRINVDFLRLGGTVLTYYALSPAYLSKNIGGKMAMYPDLLKNKWAPVEDKYTAIHRLRVMLADAMVDDWKIKRVPLSSNLTQIA